MKNIFEKIKNFGIVPVIKIDDLENAIPLAKALCKGGLPIAELTFRTDCAKDAIKAIADNVPEMILGAGTVLSTDMVDEAVNAGAKFIVSPGLNPKVVKYCVDKKIPIIPGCANPSDIELALEFNLSVVKFFPAEQAGGLEMIKAMSAPYTKLKFMPTGGINQNNINKYLEFDKIIACGGSWMVKDTLIINKEFDKITELTKGAIDQILGFEIAHVGINANDESEAITISEKFCSVFNKPFIDGNMSIFAGGIIEVMKTPYLGKNGHIGFKTNNILRAINYLEMQGITFNESTRKYDSNENLKTIYFKEEIGGFAVHLIQK